MEVEYLESGSADCPLIRIYGDEPEVCRRLQDVFERLATGNAQEVSLTDLPGVDALSGCRLIAQVSRRDRGIVRTGANVFSWVLTPTTWDNVAFLIEPFCQPEPQRGGYQWLDQVPAGDARVLVSRYPAGDW
jgi:hypothetical protein